jgi:hypothetical protein
MATRHEIPTHLAVEDRLLAGLTMPQLLVLLVGGCAGYLTWQGAAFLPATVRLTLAGAALLASAVVALVRPHGRSLLAWTLVVLRYLALPRVCLWRAGAAPSTAEAGRGMCHFAPSVAWAAGGGVLATARAARR